MKGPTIKIPDEHYVQLRNIVAQQQIDTGKYSSVSKLVKEIIASYLETQMWSNLAKNDKTKGCRDWT